MPELISRQLAGWITDKQGFSVLESTVYRILRRAGLVKRPEMRLAAGKEYHRKPTGPHQMWATDASYFRVVGWDYYSMVTVMDDYSRFILAHKLQRDMTADFFIEVVQEAVDRTGMDRVPVTDRTRLLSDNGPGYVSRAFRDYLGMLGIKHILATPFHPQTSSGEDSKRSYNAGRRCRLERSNGDGATTRPSGSSATLHPTPDLSASRVSHFCWLLTDQTAVDRRQLQRREAIEQAISDFHESPELRLSQSLAHQIELRLRMLDEIYLDRS